MSKETFKCGQCGKEFDTRSNLSKHIYRHRVENEERKKIEGPIIIPKNKVDEFQYLKNGQYARVYCDGTMTDEGLEVYEVTYVK